MPIMFHLVLLCVAVSLDVSVAVWDEERKVVCSGRDFHLPVQNRLRVVAFTPSSPPGPARVVLDNNKALDDRFEWRREKILLVREVTERDQGLFIVKTLTGVVEKKIRLIVEDCVKSTTLFYGDDFKIDMLSAGALLEFIPQSSAPRQQPITLWNGTNPQEPHSTRGRVKGGRWLLEGVTQADGGNYTLKDATGRFIYKVHLSVEEHGFSVTQFSGESLALPLYLPATDVHLSFIPSTSHSSSSSYLPSSPRLTVPLVRDGQVVVKEERYKGQVMLSEERGTGQVVISQLRLEDTGVYEIRDKDGNLVSSTWLEVVRKPKWKANFKSIAAPLCGFGVVAAVIIFKKRYATWSLLKNRNAPGNVNMVPFNPPVYSEAYTPSHPSSYPCPPHWNAPPSSGLAPVVKGAYTPPTNRAADGDQGHSMQTQTTSLSASSAVEGGKSPTFSLNSDCLRSSEACVQFRIEGKKAEEQQQEEDEDKDDPTLPLSTDTSQSCSVYTSDKLNFL